MENQVQSISNIFTSSLQSFVQAVMQSMPKVIGALLLLIIGWLLARGVALVAAKILKVMKFDSLAGRVKAQQMLEKAHISLSPSEIIGKFAYWIILLLFFVTATDTLGLPIVSTQISKLIAFLPTLLSGIFIFILGTYIAGFFRDIIHTVTSSLGVTTGKVISTFVFYFLLIIVALTTLQQIGIDTTIITSNVVLFLGAILLSASISYGFASREVLSNILASFFTKRTFLVGQVIKVDDVQGQITRIDGISITLQTPTEKIILPIKSLIDRKVYIIQDIV